MERSLGNKQNTVRKESRKKEKRKVKSRKLRKKKNKESQKVKSQETRNIETYVEKEDSTYTKSKTGSKILNMKLRKHKRRVKW